MRRPTTFSADTAGHNAPIVDSGHQAHGNSRRHARHDRDGFARRRFAPNGSRIRAGVLRSERHAPGAARSSTPRSDSATTSSARSGWAGIPNSTTRIVFDMEGVDSYSVFTLYSPYRLVIDFKPVAGAPVDCRARSPRPVSASQRGTQPRRAAPSGSRVTESKALDEVRRRRHVIAAAGARGHESCSGLHDTGRRRSPLRQLPVPPSDARDPRAVGRAVCELGRQVLAGAPARVSVSRAS